MPHLLLAAATAQQLRINDCNNAEQPGLQPEGQSGPFEVLRDSGCQQQSAEKSSQAGCKSVKVPFPELSQPQGRLVQAPLRSALQSAHLSLEMPGRGLKPSSHLRITILSSTHGQHHDGRHCLVPSLVAKLSVQIDHALSGLAECVPCCEPFCAPFMGTLAMQVTMGS